MPARETLLSSRKIDFFIVGAAKAGTTSVFRYLSQHPRLFMPEDKEPHFFGDQRPFAKYGLYPRYEDYMALFAGAGAGQLLGEGSTAYLYSETAPGELHRYNRAAKIVILLRDPRDRAYSLYWHHVRDFSEPKGVTFEQALAREDERIATKWAFGFHYLRSGLYHEQVQRYLDRFATGQVRIVLMEDLIAQPEETMNGLCDFLGVERAAIETGDVHNRSGMHRNRLIAYWFARPNALRTVAKKVLPASLRQWRERIVQGNLLKPEPMDAETRARLTEYFRADVVKLERLIGRDLTAWKT
jgi:hypothetical protein